MILQKYIDHTHTHDHDTALACYTARQAVVTVRLLVAARLPNHKVPHVGKHGLWLIVWDSVSGFQDVVIAESALDMGQVLVITDSEIGMHGWKEPSNIPRSPNSPC